MKRINKVTSLAQYILAEAGKLPEGGLVSPKDFLHRGSRGNVDRTLGRLEKAGKLRRVGRGLYVLPVHGRFGVRCPNVDKVLASLSARTGERFVSHGAFATNYLGFSNQVPLRDVRLTTGKSRELWFGKLPVRLIHAPDWKFLFGICFENAMILAMDNMGEQWAREYIPHIRNMGTMEQWKKLYSVRSQLPGWMAEVIGKVRWSKRKRHRTDERCHCPVERIDGKPF